MLAPLIRTFTSAFYKYPQVHITSPPTGPFSRLKLALVVDHFTEASLSVECQVNNITPWNYREILGDWKPDLFFVESTFHGSKGSWRYELAKQPHWLRLTKPQAIYNAVQHARSLGIPTVFWNKDDGIFFDDFVDVARHFDHIFTSDVNYVSQYRALVPTATSVHTLMMAYQPAFHFFDGFHFETVDACFPGSYYRQILDSRRQYMDMLFRSIQGTGLYINAFDRNHDRFSRFFEFRFPKVSGVRVFPALTTGTPANCINNMACPSMSTLLWIQKLCVHAVCWRSWLVGE